jgi:transcriptional regulator with XRE-family HTH domain
MLIGERIKELREAKRLSQGDIEKRTGLIRCYTSRVENGHTVPTVETLEKYAHALEVPIYQLFYEGEEPPKPPKLPKGKSGDGDSWGRSGKDARTLHRFQVLLKRMGQRDRELLLSMAATLARRKTRRAKT